MHVRGLALSKSCVAKVQKSAVLGMDIAMCLHLDIVLQYVNGLPQTCTLHNSYDRHRLQYLRVSTYTHSHFKNCVVEPAW